MSISCGTDIIEIERIRRSIEKLGEKFLNEVYTDKEIQYCESRKKQKYQHYAARFAAKEAIFKAISRNLKDKYEVGWKDIEVLNDEQSRPYVKIKEEIKTNIDISISHCKEYAVATAIMITEENMK